MGGAGATASAESDADADQQEGDEAAAISARADAAPVTPCELMQIELPLLPTAALIRRGHHLRLALVGALSARAETWP